MQSGKNFSRNLLVLGLVRYRTGRTSTFTRIAVAYTCWRTLDCSAEAGPARRLRSRLCLSSAPLVPFIAVRDSDDSTPRPHRDAVRCVDMSNPPKRPRSPAVAIDPCLQGQYASSHAAGQPTEGSGRQQAKKRRAGNSQAMTAVDSDYTDTLLNLLRQNSAGAAPEPDRTALPGGFVDSAANRLSAGPDSTDSGHFDRQTARPAYDPTGHPVFPPVDASDPSSSTDPSSHAPAAGTSSSANVTPPVAGPSGASSSTRASPANLPSLPDTFPEPPVPVQAEDGSLPARSDFAEGLDAYVQSLHPIKRNKALSASALRAFDLLHFT